ncbi:hypothetical protein [Agromyces bauzanensis]|uniref:Uncharacterized protein n=1 Tax=Agromyces bauzanensis TaxID=1308924 RepID=A0A917UP97_9MICO|nr:hypothetical protein [Agromyces bauzanensis]GGJ72031.1 hypothetical protein GCM10011372_07500 [Agromyces bauzanensis]
MERIYYAGDQFLTGTAIANALVSYAAALGRRGTTGAIEIPVRHPDDGRLSVVNFLVGPASQIVTERIDAGDDDELRDEQLVERLRSLTAELAPMHPITNHGVPDTEQAVDYDWTDEV